MVQFVDTCIESLDPDAPAQKLIECGRAIHDYLRAVGGGGSDARMISIGELLVPAISVPMLNKITNGGRPAGKHQNRGLRQPRSGPK
jgi:hypothetical protein